MLGDHKLSGPEMLQTWGAAEESQLAALKRRGISVGRVVSTPQLPADPIDCLAEGRTPESCAISRDVAFAPVQAIFDVEAQAAERVEPAMPVFDISDELCPGDTCPVEIDGTIVYSDVGHLYQGFTVRQVPAIVRFLNQVAN